MLKLTLNTFKERLAGEKFGGLTEIASFGDISGAVKKKIVLSRIVMDMK